VQHVLGLAATLTAATTAASTARAATAIPAAAALVVVIKIILLRPHVEGSLLLPLASGLRALSIRASSLAQGAKFSARPRIDEPE
jgi:hypothetical protein